MFGKRKEPSVALIEKPATPLAKVMSDKRGRGVITQVLVRYDCGFGNNLFIRGEGAGLKWEEGLVLRNIKPNEWMWETSDPFDECRFKILINDMCYEKGENHSLSCGKVMIIEPVF